MLSLYVLSVLMLVDVGPSSLNPETYRTGELETVSKCEYEYVCLSSL